MFLLRPCGGSGEAGSSSIKSSLCHEAEPGIPQSRARHLDIDLIRVASNHECEFESRAIPATRRLLGSNRSETEFGLWTSRPSAHQRLGRVSRLDPDTRKRRCFANTKVENNFGHDSSFQHRASSRLTGQCKIRASDASSPDFGIRRVGRATGFLEIRGGSAHSLKQGRAL